MKVEVYSFVWNEIAILPWVVDYWKEYATHVTVFDNGSDDGSREFLESFDWITVLPFDMGDGMNDTIFRDKKNECWKESRGNADYVVVCDADEMICAYDIKGALFRMKESGATICKPKYYDFISDERPVYVKGKKLHKISPLATINDGSKALLFDPNAIDEINYTHGAHKCSPTGRVKWYDGDEIYYLHISHNLSFEYKMERIAELNERRSKENVKRGFGIHYTFSKEHEWEYWQKQRKEAADFSNIIGKPSIKGRVAAMALCRLGNQMFIAAAARTYAHMTGREFWGLVYTDNKADYPDEQKRIMRNVRYVRPESLKNYTLIPKGKYLCNGFPKTDSANVLLCDFFQDASCIDKKIAYDLFAPYDSILEEIKNTYGDVSDYVCVNVRRGDYLERGNDKLGFRTLSKADIDAILNEYFPDDKILFVSDDIEWCKKNFVGDRYLFADKPCKYKPEMDLYLQTQCKANVMSNSTFSWWGAYLNAKAEKVICPWPWFTDNKINPMKNILPKGWIKWKG